MRLQEEMPMMQMPRGLRRNYSKQSFLTDEANKSIAYSDTDHYQAKIKRNNLIGLFLEGVEIDKYITTHLYGEMK